MKGLTLNVSTETMCSQVESQAFQVPSPRPMILRLSHPQLGELEAKWSHELLFPTNPAPFPALPPPQSFKHTNTTSPQETP